MTPLFLAITEGDLPMVRLLVQNRADVNASTEFRSRPLHAAFWSGRTELVEMLLAAGADPTAGDELTNDYAWDRAAGSLRRWAVGRNGLEWLQTHDLLTAPDELVGGRRVAACWWRPGRT